MFYYLGRKKAAARLYPPPRCDRLVEPFAGSAAYSLHADHWKREVVLNDLDPMVCRVWRYLQRASEHDILSLPVPARGTRLSSIQTLSEEERWLVAQHINPGADQRSDVVTAFSRWPAGRRYIASSLHKIRHFTILEGDYRDIPAHLAGTEASWFVDPPYEGLGHYRTSAVDHRELGAWCRTLHGQVIVCERQGAGWLPFVPLASLAICGRSVSREAVFVSDDGGDGRADCR